MDRLRVLVVDDEPLARAVLCEHLGAFPDIELVGEAEGGIVAIDQVGALHPDLVFLDLTMPELDGLGVLRRLQNAERAPFVVIVTADMNRVEEAAKFGAVGSLHKPVSHSRLSQCLDMIRNIQADRRIDRLSGRLPR